MEIIYINSNISNISTVYPYLQWYYFSDMQIDVGKSIRRFENGVFNVKTIFTNYDCVSVDTRNPLRKKCQKEWVSIQHTIQ